MRFTLAEPYSSKLRDQFVEALSNLDFDNSSDKECVIAGLVDGFFHAHRLDLSHPLRPLVGAAAVLIAQAPKHDKECNCHTCILKFGLEYALHETEEVREAVRQLGDDLAHNRHHAKGKNWMEVQEVEVRRILPLLIEEHETLLKEGRY